MSSLTLSGHASGVIDLAVVLDAFAEGGSELGRFTSSCVAVVSISLVFMTPMNFVVVERFYIS